MEEIEKLANDYRDMFDDREPDSGHFTRFERKLNRSAKSYGMRSRLLQIAAAFMAGIFIASGSYYYLSHQDEKTVMSELPGDVRETLYYYNSVTSEMISEIKSYPAFDKETRNKLLKDVNNRDTDYQKLLDDLKKYPGDERVINALIEYHRARVEFLQYVLSQLESKQKIESVTM